MSEVIIAIKKVQSMFQLNICTVYTYIAILPGQPVDKIEKTAHLSSKDRCHSNLGFTIGLTVACSFCFLNGLVKQFYPISGFVSPQNKRFFSIGQLNDKSLVINLET